MSPLERYLLLLLLTAAGDAYRAGRLPPPGVGDMLHISQYLRATQWRGHFEAAS